ncbi:MAG: hypothetical protein IJL63_02835 [Clostridia bacterium]|nr:hypothetical protein [Clostridia bacterium]
MDEQIMRTSVFGGFKKDDVLSYVEKLQKEIASLQAELDAKANEISSLESNAAELEEKTAELESVSASLEEANRKIDELTEENGALTQKADALGEIADEYVNAKAQLEKESLEIKQAQARLGAAFIDARKYSDNLVAAANERAMKASQGFSQDISRQAGEITKLSAEIDKLSAQFNSTVNTLHSDIAVLAQRMSASAMNLRQRNEASFEPNLNVSFEVDDDATGVINTDDGSGLTYIQYPPHTRFNEDLDIKPLGDEEQA